MTTQRSKTGILSMTAVISAEILILKNLPDDGFALDLGALTLSLGKRNFILDSMTTEFQNRKKKGKKITFETDLDIDKDTFEEGEEYNYELTEEDLTNPKLKATFFCSDQDAGIDDAFDFDNAKIECTVKVGDKEYKVKVTFE